MRAPRPRPAELMDDETFAGAIVRIGKSPAQVLEVDFEESGS